MKYFCSLLINLVITLAIGIPAASGNVAKPHSRLVLVTYNKSNFTSFNFKNLRKLFLGSKVFQNDHRIIPLINSSDNLIDQIFLQKIVFMSKRHFSRLLMSNTYRRGTTKPRTYKSIDHVVQQLKETPNAVTYMWEKSAKKHNLTIVQELWHGAM